MHDIISFPFKAYYFPLRPDQIAVEVAKIFPPKFEFDFMC